MAACGGSRYPAALAITTATYGRKIAAATRTQRTAPSVTTAPMKQAVRTSIDSTYLVWRLRMSVLRGPRAEVMLTAAVRRSTLPTYVAPAQTTSGDGGLVAGQYDLSMANRTYRVTEIVGTSPEGVDAAVRNGVHRAGQTLRHLDWFEVTQVRGQVVDGEVEHFQVTMKLGFRLEDDE